MELYYCGIIVLLVICIGLIIKLRHKQVLDYKHKKELICEIDYLEGQVQSLKNQCDYENYHLNEIKCDLAAAQQVYQETKENKIKELDSLLEHEKSVRQATILDSIQHQKEVLELQYQQRVQEVQNKQNQLEEALIYSENEFDRRMNEINEDLTNQQIRFNSLLEPLRQYEKEKQERLFYTIQVPDEYKNDIDFLLTTVSQKVNHPDIINKLVWAEYVKPYMDEMIKRVDIKEQPGIYKITNIDTGKCYIGKSTNVKKRLQDHMRSTIGIRTIADQAVHHAMLDSGFWNWTFEIITYCDKEQLNELEKYYINFFQSQTFGYNKTGGGEG